MSLDPVTESLIDALVEQAALQQAVCGHAALSTETDLMREGVFLSTFQETADDGTGQA